MKKYSLPGTGDQGTNQLLNQLIVNKQIFHTTKNGISDNRIRERVERLYLQQDLFIKELSKIFNIELKKYTDENKSVIESLKNKIGDQFDHSIGTDDKVDIISFVIASQKQLAKLYDQLIYNSTDFDEIALMILKNQLNEIRRDRLSLAEFQDGKLI